MVSAAAKKQRQQLIILALLGGGGLVIVLFVYPGFLVQEDVKPAGVTARQERAAAREKAAADKAAAEAPEGAEGAVAAPPPGQPAYDDLTLPEPVLIGRSWDPAGGLPPEMENDEPFDLVFGGPPPPKSGIKIDAFLFRTVRLVDDSGKPVLDPQGKEKRWLEEGDEFKYKDAVWLILNIDSGEQIVEIENTADGEQVTLSTREPD